MASKMIAIASAIEHARWIHAEDLVVVQQDEGVERPVLHRVRNRADRLIQFRREGKRADPLSPNVSGDHAYCSLIDRLSLVVRFVWCDSQLAR